jgi:hypothetical protein
MEIELTHEFDFNNGVQVSKKWVENAHKEIVHFLSNHEENFAINRRSTGNGFVIGIKSNECIKVYEVENGYKKYTYGDEFAELA